MTFARAASFPKGFSRTIFRRAGATSRNRSWKQVGRRGYASEHGHGQQQSSELPWIIGSAAVTIPAAGWLLQQGPKKGDHGHDAHHEKHEEKEEEQPEEEESKEEDTQEESKDEDKEESKDEDKEEDKEEGKEESKDEDKDDSGDDEEKSSKSDGNASEDGYELPGPNASQQINWNSSMSKGPGEGQKGERKPTEKKSEKDAQGDKSGAKHPYIDDPEKSKKGVGVTETAKIHGTVDPSAGARGAKQSGEDSS